MEYSRGRNVGTLRIYNAGTDSINSHHGTIYCWWLECVGVPKDVQVSDPPSTGILFDVEDPLGRRIRLSENQWYGHVLDQHPELATMVIEVQAALTHPDLICTDAVKASRVCHYRRTSYGSSPKYMKVIVHRESGAVAGEVITAFMASRRRSGEEVIYGERIP